MSTTSNPLHEVLWTTDAAVWADEFCKMNPSADWGTMVSWFANAIENTKSITREGGQ